MAADLKGFLCNCFVGGETSSVQSGGGWVRDTLEVRFGGWDLKIVQKPEALAFNPSKYNGYFVETTTVVVRDVLAEDREEIRELLERLSYLLSFAGCSQVACYGWEHGEDPPLREHWATVARARFFSPTLDIRRGEVVRRFLEGVWPEYFRLEGQRDLRRVIDLFVIAETHGLPLELRLATLFILLENMKSTYAREQGFQFNGRNYLKPSGRAWGFNGLVSEMLKDAGMKQPDLGPIVDLRNDIVHSGASQTTFEHQDQIYDDCQDIAREYLLRSWGYSGEFRSSAGRGMTVKRI